MKTLPKPRKKIFIATPFESRLPNRGTRLPVIADMLVNRGCDVEYVTTNFDHARKRYFGGKEIEECKTRRPYKLTVLKVFGYSKNISIRRVLTHIYLSVRYFIYLVRRLKMGDVVVIPSRPPELILCAAIACGLRRASVVLDITDIWPDMLHFAGRTHFQAFKIYCNIFLTRAMKRITRFIHSSPNFLEWVNRYAPGSTSTFVSLGFDRERWDTIRPGSRQRGDKLSLVCVTLLQRQIDVMPILEALVNRKRFTFSIIGDDGTGERFQECRSFIEKHGMDDVCIVGRLSPEDVVEHLKRHDIGIVPMISSSIPNKVFDYIGAHIPIISLGDMDASQFVRDNDIGWTAPFDGERVGQLLDSISDEEINNKAANVEAIRETYSRDNLYKSYVEVIESAS
ncbi:MAG: glycosyltransferase [Planctomycetota bacterium]|nr:glycosyltransferase [Planctomycetota bacterium]